VFFSPLNESIAKSIVIKPSPGVDPVRGWVPGFMGQPRKIKKKIKVLIFYIKKSM
jgi:hypothetical protein